MKRRLKKCKLLCQKGFTLLELVLVIVLMGIMGAATLSFDYDTSPMTAEMLRRKIAEDIRYAQSRALTNKGTFGFRANTSTTYEIYETTAGNPINSPVDGTPMSFTLSDDFRDATFVAGEFPAFDISFDENGKPNILADTTVSVNSGSTTKTLLVIVNSGTVILP